jgi:phage shock protein E
MKKIYISILVITAALIGGFFASEQKPAAAFLDVRTMEEWKNGHIHGAIHIDLANIKQGELPNISKDTEIFIYCRSGKRASEAAQILRENNFTRVINAGGFSDLQTKGEKVCYGVIPDCG